ncbi:MAG: hypothetical protein M1829_000842 [Trizodia sp. TS-e1964]|nr:MAG: hypothetical protein M1829_000842 [Trizodia sp. TS-e1964]
MPLLPTSSLSALRRLLSKPPTSAASFRRVDTAAFSAARRIQLQQQHQKPIHNHNQQHQQHQQHKQHQQQYRSYSNGAPPPPQSPLKVWPFILILLSGSGAYMFMVQQRLKESTSKTSMPALPPPSEPTPAFSPSSVAVIFVLGGPGSGKGTQCARLVRDFHFTHLSAGDLLRAEQTRPGSEFGAEIRAAIKNGDIVRQEVTVALLSNAIRAALVDGRGKFLIDGFPRKMDQAVLFEKEVVPARFTLFYECGEEVMRERILVRGQTSGREDDNVESIKKRFRTFVDTSMPVVRYFEAEGRVVSVDAARGVDEVYEDTKRACEKWLGGELGK